MVEQDHLKKFLKKKYCKIIEMVYQLELTTAEKALVKQWQKRWNLD